MYGVGPQPPRIEPATQANVRIRARKIVRSRNAASTGSSYAFTARRTNEHKGSRVTEQLDAVYSVEHSKLDEPMRRAGRRTLKRNGW